MYQSYFVKGSWEFRHVKGAWKFTCSFCTFYMHMIHCNKDHGYFHVPFSVIRIRYMEISVYLLCDCNKVHGNFHLLLICTGGLVKLSTFFRNLFKVSEKWNNLT